ncbi:SRPBCC family protein [uncultured Lentibacter sp.]|uniref:aromatic ring-hydroxylating oxygenase subunit alpha n=1 Tax=uncultured Lentibacter sp. TaxID=1659309 RepID=UPI00261FF513|nr:SRPBCC family protein [uncultured Lentibacter sp.]
MDRKTEVGLIREIVGLADQKSSFLDREVTHSPISRYASPERFEREMAMIFRRKPVVAAHSSELEGQNAFITRDFLGLPLLLTRDANSEVHAFLNVCRHRGAKVEREATGCKRVFTCPYHAWSWSNRGDLRAVPQEAQGFPDLPRAERGLRRLPVAEAHGFIWIIANPDAGEMPRIDDWLSDLSPDFAWLGLNDHRIALIDTLDINANWKVLIEGGLEAYHFRVAHKKTIGPHFPDNLLTYKQFGPHMRAVLPRNALPELGGTPEEQWILRKDANMVYTVQPNTQMLVQQDHFMWFHIEPISEAKTRFRMATVVPNNAPRTDDMEKHWQLNHRISLTALKEDFELGEEIQAGFASRGNPTHIFGRFEGALNRFNLVIEEMLAN